MLQPGDHAIAFSLPDLAGETRAIFPGHDPMPVLLAFFETNCPTCQLMFPYLTKLAERTDAREVAIIGLSQDNQTATRLFAEQFAPRFPIVLDRNLAVSRQYEPLAVPTLYLLARAGVVAQVIVAFDKGELNELAVRLFAMLDREPFVLAEAYDGAPASKPGCTSRHLEPQGGDETDEETVNPYLRRGQRATKVELTDGEDAVAYCLDAGFDPLPVVPPTLERVERMMQATAGSPEDIVALVPPNYGPATVEKIAANAVMAGCTPEMLRVLIPLVRAACDERFNLHGVQATTHFAAPLVIVNGPVRHELPFACGSNVFSNVARANSAIGRALQLILINLGGARPGEMDMSTLGNAGKFSFCIAENEEENPWQPLHVDRGFHREQSAVTLFAAEPPRGVSEHKARNGRTVLKAMTRALATIWSYRACALFEALVVVCPEHARTLLRDGFSKGQVRDFLFENTAIPIAAFEEDDDGEGVSYAQLYERVVLGGVPCYRKFRQPEQIHIVVAGGTAGKFSAVIGSWVTGPGGSQMVTYPID